MNPPAPATDPVPAKPRSWLGLAVLLLLGSAVFGGLPVYGLLYLSASRPEGQPLDAERARALVGEKAVLLTELRELQANGGDAARAQRQQELVARLGALAVVPPDADGGLRLVFRRYGEPGAMHEQLLEWLSPAAAAGWRSATPPNGEQREELADGWWWVQR